MVVPDDQNTSELFMTMSGIFVVYSRKIPVDTTDL